MLIYSRYPDRASPERLSQGSRRRCWPCCPRRRTQGHASITNVIVVGVDAIVSDASLAVIFILLLVMSLAFPH